jgi:hypothetical protein
VYCHNDPINYTDPSGQFVAAYLTSVAVSTVVGGVVGAITGGIAYAVANPCEDVWQSSGFWKAVGIGFVSGMAGGFVGGVVGGGLGMLGWAVVSPYLASVGLVGWIAAGVGIGAVSGAAGGAAGGAASQLVWNALWGRPLWDNVGRAALTGAIIGGVLGGILGGIHGARAYGQYQAALAATPNAVGQAGEKAAGITGPKRPIDSLTGTAKYRKPDEIDDVARVLKEVKNVAKLSNTSQIRDYVLWAQENGYTFKLITRQGTEFSKPLQKLIDNGTIILEHLPW